jgi:hypothetical protein
MKNGGDKPAAPLGAGGRAQLRRSSGTGRSRHAGTRGRWHRDLAAWLWAKRPRPSSSPPPARYRPLRRGRDTDDRGRGVAEGGAAGRTAITGALGRFAAIPAAAGLTLRRSGRRPARRA